MRKGRLIRIVSWKIVGGELLCVMEVGCLV